MDAPTPPPTDGPVDPSVPGPLTREQARAFLARADALLESGDFADAARHYQRVVGHPAPDVPAPALLGFGEALYRLDDEDGALAAWRSVLDLPETPATYAAWRNVAAALVRSGDLRGALDAYRQAERRAPPGDRAEIASRLGWLTKELGDSRSSRRYFARARGDGGLVSATTAVILVTVAVSFACFTTFGEQNILPVLLLDKTAVANGEYWRLVTVTLVHGNWLHLAFNMYALWLVGPIVERFYGPAIFLLMYLLTAAAGSVASFVFSAAPSVGASGAVFGLVGVLIAAERTHDPMVDRRTRALISQLIPLVILNLVLNLFQGYIDIAAHVGGLAAGLWLGWLLAPARVATLATSFQRPAGQTAGQPGGAALRWLGVVALVGVLVAGIAIGTPARKVDQPSGQAATVGAAAPAGLAPPDHA